MDNEDMPYSLLRSNVVGIFRAGACTKLPSEVLPLWDDPKKEEVLEVMPDFIAWGLTGRDDHDP